MQNSWAAIWEEPNNRWSWRCSAAFCGNTVSKSCGIAQPRYSLLFCIPVAFLLNPITFPLPAHYSPMACRCRPVAIPSHSLTFPSSNDFCRPPVRFTFYCLVSVACIFPRLCALLMAHECTRVAFDPIHHFRAAAACDVLLL